MNTSIGVGYRAVTAVPKDLLALVPRPEGDNRNIKGTDPDPIHDTVPLIKRMVRRQLWQGKKLARRLKGSSLKETLRNDWNFIFNHIQYVEDGSDETVRSLRRLIYDGRGDCDCFVSALSNLLLNQQIPHLLRVTRYDGSPDWSHIYIVVPLDGKVDGDPSNYITMDCVPHQFNFEVPFTDKQDFPMKLQSLDGLGAAASSPKFFHPSYLSLNGLGCACGCGSKAEAPTAAGNGAEEEGNGGVQLISVQKMAELGLMKTTSFLDEKGISYTVNEEDYSVNVPTPNGITRLEAFVPLDTKGELLTSLTTSVESIKSNLPQPLANGNTAGKVVLGLGIGALVIWGISSLVSSGNPKPPMGKVPRKKYARVEKELHL